MAAKSDPRFKVVADNRKARFNYAIGETFEAGIALTGSEVKSMRAGKTSIGESYAAARDKRQINKLIGAVEREGMTVVPLKIYFNERGRAKVEIALAKGKKLHDKREAEKKRDWSRERGRLLRQKG
jgi:SsrA-binding protein